VVVYFIDSKQTLLLSTYMAQVFTILVTQPDPLNYSAQQLIKHCEVDQMDQSAIAFFHDCLLKLIELQLVESFE